MFQKPLHRQHRPKTMIWNPCFRNHELSHWDTKMHMVWTAAASRKATPKTPIRRSDGNHQWCWALNMTTGIMKCPNDDPQGDCTGVAPRRQITPTKPSTETPGIASRTRKANHVHSWAPSLHLGRLTSVNGVLQQGCIVQFHKVRSRHPYLTTQLWGARSLHRRRTINHYMLLEFIWSLWKRHDVERKRARIRAFLIDDDFEIVWMVFWRFLFYVT